MGSYSSIFAVRRSLTPEFPGTVQDVLTVAWSVMYADKKLTYASDVTAAAAAPVASQANDHRRNMRRTARAYRTHRNMKLEPRRMSGFDRQKDWTTQVPSPIQSAAPRPEVFFGARHYRLLIPDSRAWRCTSRSSSCNRNASSSALRSGDQDTPGRRREMSRCPVHDCGPRSSWLHVSDFSVSVRRPRP